MPTRLLMDENGFWRNLCSGAIGGRLRGDEEYCMCVSAGIRVIQCPGVTDDVFDDAMRGGPVEQALPGGFRGISGRKSKEGRGEYVIDNGVSINSFPTGRAAHCAIRRSTAHGEGVLRAGAASGSGLDYLQGERGSTRRRIAR